MSAWFMRRRSISPGGRTTLHSTRGLGLADGRASQNLYSPSGVCVSSVS